MNRNNEVIYHDDELAISKLLIGRKVVQVDMDTKTLRLDDGTILTIEPNEGGCSCGAGDYALDDLNVCDNVITSVEVVAESKDAYDSRKVYRVFVFAEHSKIKLLQVSGDDGNGWYGTGYRIFVSAKQEVQP